MEKSMKFVFASSAAFSIFALAIITIFLFTSGIPFVAKVGCGNFFGAIWNPHDELYGVSQMLVATLYTTALSVVIGAGIGLLCAVGLYKFCHKKLVVPATQLINLLAGIPSVVYGLLGMQIIVPFVRDNLSPNGVGYGIFSASLVLAIMILPTIVSVSFNALLAVPANYFEGALALGATKEQATFKVLVPAAKSGILAGTVLGIGRALGETMAVIMVIGNSPELPTSIFQSTRTLTANIALGALELDGDPKIALIASGTLLFAGTLLLNLLFGFLNRGNGKRS